LLDDLVHLSPELAALFPSGVLAAEASTPIGLEALTPSELQSIAHCAQKRIRDFTAGRACAHRVLRELGIVNYSLLAGAQREPLWPASVAGSITHSDDYAAAVVAHCDSVTALGIDCEGISVVNAELWDKICVPEEARSLGLLPAGQQTRYAGLIFAAKEAFYKCQFPLTRAWVGFEDVRIEVMNESASTGALHIVPERPLPLDLQDRPLDLGALVCRYLFRERHVLVGVSLPARSTSTVT
jgi:4'-phosphopantetheinyl transferase EntD